MTDHHDHLAMERCSKSGLWCRPLLAVGLVVFSIIGGQLPNVRAQEVVPQVATAGMSGGTVTNIYADSVDINGINFRLASDVTIVDPKGEPMDLSTIRVTAEVKYMVKREQPNRIVKLIVYLPQ